MFNTLKSIKAVITAEPRSARTKAPTQDNLAKAQAKILALKVEIEASQAEARALAELQSQEIAKAERLRQAGRDLLLVHKDLQTARAKASTAEASVRTAAAATQAADLELHSILASLDTPTKPPTPVAKPVKLAVASPAPAPIAEFVLPAPPAPPATPAALQPDPSLNPFTD